VTAERELGPAVVDLEAFAPLELGLAQVLVLEQLRVHLAVEGMRERLVGKVLEVHVGTCVWCV
jgi:hypothetical protein